MQVSLGNVVSALGPTIGPEQSAEAALALLSAADAPEACVTSADGRFLGIVTDYELLKAALNGSLGELQIEQIMHRRPMTLTADETLADAARLFRDGGLSRVPVLRDGRLLGVVRRRDVLLWFARRTPIATSTAVQAPRFLTTPAANRETAGVGS